MFPKVYPSLLVTRYTGVYDLYWPLWHLIHLITAVSADVYDLIASLVFAAAIGESTSCGKTWGEFVCTSMYLSDKAAGF